MVTQSLIDAQCNDTYDLAVAIENAESIMHGSADVELSIENKGWITVIAFIFLFLLVYSAPLIGQIQFESIGNTADIPDNVVTDLAQDADGYLWIATAAGVVRHDGYRFKLFRHDPLDNTSLGGNFVRDINVFEDGTLWLSTEPGGVSIYHPDSERFTRLFDQKTLLDLPDLSSVSQVLPGFNDDVWLSTNSGIYRATTQGNIIKHYSTADGIPHSGIRALLRDSQGNLWVGTKAGLAQYSAQDDHFQPIQMANGAHNTLYIRSLFEANDGRIWIGTNESGVWLYDHLNHHMQPALPNQPEALKSSTVYDIFQLNDNEIWAARFGGIDRIDEKSGNWLSRVIHDPSDSFSLANNDIRTLLKDRSGVVWIGGYGGGLQRLLSKVEWLQSFRFSLINDNGLTEPNVSSILALSNGLIWVGTRGGGIDIVDPDVGVIGGHYPQTGVPGKLHAGWITAMTELTSGDIWVGVNPGQLYRFDKQKQQFFLYGQQHGLPKGNVRALYPSVKGGLWIGTNAGLFYWDDKTGEFATYTLANGDLMQDWINALYEDGDGRLLVATGASGLYVVPPDSQNLLQIKGANEYGESLQTTSIVGMLYDSAGRLWLDTTAGLHLVNFTSPDKVQLQNHSQHAGFGGRPMGANLLEDAMGRIWTPDYIYDPASKVMTPLQKADGIEFGTNWFRSYTKSPDGRLLFGGSKGLLIIDPDGYSFWDYQPSLVATELRVDGVSVNAGMLRKSGLTIQPEQRSFTIEFAALDLSAPEKNRYRYKLKGFDNDWVEVDASRRVASYSNLWPGTYAFTVQGTNRAGHWSGKDLTFNVVVEAAYWQTHWFIALCSILAISLTYLGFRIRTHWIEARAQELETQVEERTLALRKAQEDFIEQEKMASLGGLVAGVSHEINTPMGIALTAATALNDDCCSLEKKVNENRLKRSELHSHLEKARTSNKIILNSLERAFTLMASFKQVAVDQTSEQRREFDLETLLEDIKHALHSLYANEGHQLKINCPQGIVLDSYPGSLFQVFTNLIKNSIIHGFVEKTQGTVSIDAKISNNLLVICYSDDGVGMTDEVKKKAFDPFFTTKLGVGGSGLGLHLVYNYVTQILGGKIRLESAPNKGFQCNIELPLIAPTKEEREP
ncbi:MAG: two-component regulator propeller domain-containing protein [Aestuariibacter sp.]